MSARARRTASQISRTATSAGAIRALDGPIAVLISLSPLDRGWATAQDRRCRVAAHPHPSGLHVRPATSSAGPPLTGRGSTCSPSWYVLAPDEGSVTAAVRVLRAPDRRSAAPGASAPRWWHRDDAGG